MNKADKPLTIHNGIQRHTSQLEQVNLLLVNFRDPFVRIGQTGKREVVFLPVIYELFYRVWPNRQDFRIPFGELRISIPQTR
jgi:hypothetical protein